jgi:hypothetical protein
MYEMEIWSLESGWEEIDKPLGRFYKYQILLYRNKVFKVPYYRPAGQMLVLGLMVYSNMQVQHMICWMTSCFTWMIDVTNT